MAEATAADYGWFKDHWLRQAFCLTLVRGMDEAEVLRRFGGEHSQPGTFTVALGRLATVGPGGRPHVMPVGVFYDPETEAVVVIGGAADLAATKKFRDAQRHPDVAVVVDDLASVDPWTPRGIEIRGRAQAYTDGGEEVGRRLGASFRFDRAWIRIRPRRILTWGIGHRLLRPHRPRRRLTLGTDGRTEGQLFPV